MSNQDDDERAEHRYDHPQCGRCWFEEWGIGKMPARVPRPLRLTCCFCGGPTQGGIFTRADPTSFKIPFCPDLLVDPVPILPEIRRPGR